MGISHTWYFYWACSVIHRIETVVCTCTFISLGTEYNWSQPGVHNAWTARKEENQPEEIWASGAHSPNHPSSHRGLQGKYFTRKPEWGSRGWCAFQEAHQTEFHWEQDCECFSAVVLLFFWLIPIQLLLWIWCVVRISYLFYPVFTNRCVPTTSALKLIGFPSFFISKLRQELKDLAFHWTKKPENRLGQNALLVTVLQQPSTRNLPSCLWKQG